MVKIGAAKPKEMEMELVYLYGYLVIGSIMSGLFIRWAGDRGDANLGVRAAITIVYPVVILLGILVALSFIASGDSDFVKSWGSDDGNPSEV